LEPSGETEKRNTSPDMKKNSASRDKDHQHDLGGGKEDSSRSGKMKARSQGPMFLRERKGVSQVKSGDETKGFIID